MTTLIPPNILHVTREGSKLSTLLVFLSKLKFDDMKNTTAEEIVQGFFETEHQEAYKELTGKSPIYNLIPSDEGEPTIFLKENSDEVHEQT